MKYDDTDYLINREESIEYKTSDTNVGSIEEYKERLMKSLNYELDKIMTRSSKVETATEILNLRQPITYMFLNLLEEREQGKKRIQELEEENKILKIQNKQVENYTEELKKYNKIVSDRIVEYKKNSIPVQKVKDILTEIQEEYNKVQEQFDCIWNKKSKDDYDKYKLQELSAMQQELGFISGKLELLEEK